MLKAGTRLVIKNMFLSNTNNASVSLRKLRLENCTLHGDKPVCARAM